MTLPRSCEVADLAAWVHKMWAFDDRIMPEDTEMAHAVRALLEAKVRAACLYAAGEYDVDALREDVDSIVSHAMGAK